MLILLGHLLDIHAAWVLRHVQLLIQLPSYVLHPPPSRYSN